MKKEKVPTLVLGLIASLMTSSLWPSISKNETSRPHAAATWVMYLLVPPYTSLTLRTCDPGPRDWMMVAVVAEPEAKVRA